MCFEETGIDLITGEGGEPTLAFRVRWKNCGSTPALGVKIIMLGIVLPTPEAAAAHAFDDVEVDDQISGVVGQGVTIDSPTGTFRVADFRSGSTVLFSRVRYRDIMTDADHISDVRLLVRTHARPDGQTTFLYQAIGGSTAT
jgi:hypothetical protein